ncbi:S41 family peptidase [Sphingobacterium oryzagri]|uniref:S41 family peptidase n=1 Tax=Sphingobacterium oryzagri TaxID=3025669 RepID=A0ABY7WHM4_9SPHI|nr:S41 family peptidase [Sphingobacterium sp. KACC 22765]WDF68109.1 S41 family peptidase [Sphingobacterium sp. KACC 22765]
MKSSKRFIVVVLSVLGLFLACKKDPADPVEPTTTGGIDKSKTYLTNEHENKVRDSIWYYFKVLSLWEKDIPPADLSRIRQAGYIRTEYSQYFETGETVVDYLKGLTRSSETATDYDRYSFLDRAGEVSGEIQNAVSTSFGMQVFYLQTQQSGTNADLYIRMVERNSPAFAAGLQRGDRIVSLNGNTNIDYNSQQSENFRTVNSYLNGGTLTLQIAKVDGSMETKTITSTRYNVDPVMDSRVLHVAGKNVGYLAFSSFVTIENQGAKTAMYNRFEQIFAGFESEGVNELVVDLRYNGGGAVITAEYLADRIAPASVGTNIMYSYAVNDVIKSWGWLNEGEEFGPVRFAKKGNLQLSRVYFLVTSGTASASELLINVLRPHMQVYMIGTNRNTDQGTVAEKTYGKPVGFFGLPIVDDAIELYVSSFKTFNSAGQGDYFAGLTPNANVWEFTSFRNFGQPDESMLAAALNHISTGSFAQTSGRMATSPAGNSFINKEKIRGDLQNNQLKNGMFKLRAIKEVH